MATEIELLIWVQELRDALVAVRARVQGEFDNPVLMSYGPLHTNADEDIVRLCDRALKLTDTP